MTTTANKVIAILESRYRATSKRAGVWRSVSPLRADANNPLNFELTITSADGEHGAWHDHKTKDGGSLYELAKHLGVDLPQRETVEDSKRAYSGLADYATFKGVPADVFANAGWREGMVWGRPALIYPTAGGDRYRFLDTSGAKFAHEKGYQSCLYGLKNAPALVQSSGLPLILCNGEPSVVVAQYHGLPAVCKTSGESARYTDEMINELCAKSSEFAIAFDCDDTGIKGAVKLADQLKAQGKTAYIVDLGLSDKGDLADLCKLYGEQSITHFKKLLDSAKTAPPPTTPPAPKTDKLSDLAKALGTLKQAVKENKTDLTKLVEDAQATIDNIARDTIAPSVIDSAQALAELDDIINSDFYGLPTAWADFNRVLGGVVAGNITVVAGATGMGKTYTAASIASHWERIGKRGLYFTTELVPALYTLRLVANLANVPMADIRAKRLTPTQRENVRFAYDVLKNNKSAFVSTAMPSQAQVKTEVYKALDRGIDFVVVDAFSNLVNLGDYSSVDAIANTLLGLAIEARTVPFLMTAQIDRKVEQRADKTPRLSDIVGGGVIAANSHLTVGVYRHDYYVERQLAEPDPQYPAGTGDLIILKQRDGGDAGKFIRLAFRGGIGFFGASDEEPF